MPTPAALSESIRRPCAVLTAVALALGALATAADPARAVTGADAALSVARTTLSGTAQAPARTTLVVDLPTTRWRTGDDYVPFGVTVGTVDGTPPASGTLVVRDLGTGEQVHHTWSGAGRSLDVSGLAPGHHELEVRFETYSAETSSEPVVVEVEVLPPSPTTTTAHLVHETVHFQNQVDVEAVVATDDGSPVDCGRLVARLADGTEMGEVAQGCSESSTLELAGFVHTFGLLPGEHDLVVRWEGTDVADAASAQAGPTLASEAGPLRFTIRAAGTTTTITGISEDVPARTVRVSVGLSGTDLGPGGQGSVVLSVDGVDVGTRALDGPGDVSFVLDGRDLPVGMLVVRARFTGSDLYLPSSTVVGWEHEAKVFDAPNPRVTGTAKVGATLRAVAGTWGPRPATLTYAWHADGVRIDGATASTLVVPASAAGKRVTVRVTGRLAGYPTTTMSSTATAPVVRGTFTAPRPTVSGTVKIGRTLTVRRGTWTPTPSTSTYVWKADGRTIATRTSSTFVVPSSARGKRLTVTVTGARTGFTTLSTTSTSTTVVR